MKGDEKMEEKDHVINFLNNKIKEISEEILYLENKRKTINSMIIDIKNSNIINGNKKISENKINNSIFEGYVIDYLKFRRGSNVKLSDLYDYMKTKYRDMGSSTFRTRLMRMKANGLIRSGRKRGYWRI